MTAPADDPSPVALSDRPGRRRAPASPIDPGSVLAAIPHPVVVVDPSLVIWYVNLAAQQFFDAGEGGLIGQPLAQIIPSDSPLTAMVTQCLSGNRSLSDYSVALETPKIAGRVVTATVAPMGDPPTHGAMTLQPISIARRIDNQLSHRNAARSVTAMAAVMAHEVKNPLSGIRGAAQLLEQSVGQPDRELTRLICDEADRIVALVDRMDAFSTDRSPRREGVNIHAVLEHVRRLAQSGFASGIRFTERYDPSLPPAHAHRDQLIQVFLNLVKNAAEAVPPSGGDIVLSTAYQRGVSIAVSGTNRRLQLPLLVSIQDNGPGIPDDLHDHLFDPFVGTKPSGSGLGLALVAKIIGDHGGIIGFETRPGRTVMKVSLPIHHAAPTADEEVPA